MTKLLCISLGSVGKRHLRNARALLADADIAVWRQHTKDTAVPAHANRMLATLDEALSFAPDAVLISSPASEHIANALAFAARGVPLFIEKPLAARYEQLGNFEPKGFAMVAYVLRFLPALRTLRELLADGSLGRVYTARIEVGQWLPDWRPDSDYRQGVSAQAKLGGGALLELSHEIDYATWLFGIPKSLLCSRVKLSELEIDVEDSAHLILEYEDKRVAVQLDFLQRRANMAVQIVAEKGTLYADLVKEEITFNDKPFPCEKLPNGNEIYLRQADFFFGKALPGYQSRYPALQRTEYVGVASAARVLKLVDLAKLSSDTGTRKQVVL